MIARIMTENQYRLTDDDAAALDKLDDPLHQAIESGDDLAFAFALERVIDFVREKGTVVPVDEVIPSDVIIPAPDMTVIEARQYLQQSDAPTADADTSADAADAANAAATAEPAE
jgi:PspA-Associated protein